MHINNPKCPDCGSRRTIKKGTQDSRQRYLCEYCNKSFSIYHGPKRPVLWIPHIDGVSFRKLGDENDLSPAQTYARVIEELDTLPDNTALTQEYCDPAKFSGILVLDGKFVRVKGHKAKIPFIYAIDYLTHDIPVGLLAVSESDFAFTELFRLLRKCNYPLKAVVCDERMTIKSAMAKTFPRAKMQLCQNHYVENIRRALRIRTEDRYRAFFSALRTLVFKDAKSQEEVTLGLRAVLNDYGHDEICREVVMQINTQREILFEHFNIPNCPKDTNLVELYNSHLNGRLKTIKSFQSMYAAQRWLNAYLVRRRTKTLTDCDIKFKRLNGFPSLYWTIRDRENWPEILGVVPPVVEHEMRQLELLPTFMPAVLAGAESI